ncbi:MAG: hypothetical protein KAV42_08670 [Candidatus Krumholzibacteria bacterium]|nr:hypothetical protein [Candidatus Krumholzibacteria bacterium]
MATTTTYRVIDTGSGEPYPVTPVTDDSTSFFMMNNLLYSRIDCKHPTNDEYFDEDVNVYLAGLLESLIDPSHHDAMRSMVMPYDLSLFESVSGQKDSRAKYMTYRMNADFLLIYSGVFNNPRSRRPDSASRFKLGDSAYLGRGKAYYSLAQSYCSQTYHKNTAIGEIMGKLSRGFEKYVEVLSTMKSEYLNIIDTISQGELYHLERSVNHEELKASLACLYDDFLDAYSRHGQEKTSSTLEILEKCALRVREADPSFKFSIKDD